MNATRGYLRVCSHRVGVVSVDSTRENLRADVTSGFGTKLSTFMRICELQRRGLGIWEAQEIGKRNTCI